MSRASSIIALALIARFASPATADLSYVVLAAYAMLGKVQIIQALILSWLFTLLNPGLAPQAEYGAIGRYLVLMAAFVSIVRLGGLSRVDRLTLSTLGLGVFFFLHGLVFSQAPDVSALKSLTWTIAAVTLMAIWSSLSENDDRRMQAWLFRFLVLVAVLSIPFLNVPDVGFLRNSRGFQGILSHPQVFGATMAVAGAFAIGMMLIQRRPLWRSLFIVAGFLAMVMLSQARTGGFALGLAVTIAVLWLGMTHHQPLRRLMPALLSKRVLTLGYALIVLVLVGNAQFIAVFQEFVTKGDRPGVSGLISAFENSRAPLYLPMIANIQQYPWTGIGFGVASRPEAMTVARDPVFGLAISAPVEKGVVPIAVLEEVGFPGALVVGFWLLFIIRRAVRNGVTTLIVALTALLINMGEAVLFSPGGMGLLCLIALSYAARRHPKAHPEVNRSPSDAR